MAHSRHFYAACLDHRNTEFLHHPDPDPLPSPAIRLRILRLQQELAQYETRCVETRHALESKTSETNAMKEHVGFLQAQLLQSDQVIAGVKDQLWGLEEELSQLQADQVALQLQLELDNANHARDEEEWGLEKEELLAQVAHLETELHLCCCSDGELDFLITPAKKGHLDRALSSPGPLNGLSLQTLLDMGEASLEVEEDIHELRMRLGESEARERSALHELVLKDKQLDDLKIQITQLKKEVTTEKDKAKDEAEDLTQEMAELRYQLMEMIEQERELRAQAVQASVLRVVELESQVKSARQEVVQALASRRDAEQQSDRLGLEIQRVRLALENAEKELKECEGKIRRAQAEVEEGRKDVHVSTEARLKLDEQLLELQVTRNSLTTENQQLKASLEAAAATTSELVESIRNKESASTEARFKLDEQLLELQVTRNSLITENQQLKASLEAAAATTSELVESIRNKEAASTEARLKLDEQLLELKVTRNSLTTENQQQKASLEEAVATTFELVESLRSNGAALDAFSAPQSGALKNEDETENCFEDVIIEQVKYKEESPNELVEVQDDASDKQVETHEGTPHEILLPPGQAHVDFEIFQSPRSSSSSVEAEVSRITGPTALNTKNRDADKEFAILPPDFNQVNHNSLDTCFGEPCIRSEVHVSALEEMQVPG